MILIWDAKTGTLTISPPQGKTNEEVLKIIKTELNALSQKLRGKNIKVSGQVTASLANFLQKSLPPLFKSISLVGFFDFNQTS